jgi:hypothetical protein
MQFESTSVHGKGVERLVTPSSCPNDGFQIVREFKTYAFALSPGTY